MTEWSNDYVRTLFDSPIESGLFFGLREAAIGRDARCNLQLFRSDDDPCWSDPTFDLSSLVSSWGLPGPMKGSLWVNPQMPIGRRFRADMLLDYQWADFGADNDQEAALLHVGKVVIECDGHAFHSSPDQRGHDAARDRFLQANGYRVLRFTGREIRRDPLGCGRQIMDFLEQVGRAAGRSWADLLGRKE